MKSETKIKQLLDEGYTIVSEGKSYTTMRKQKEKFIGWLFLILLLLWIFPAIIYLVYYCTRSEKNVTIQK